MSKDANYHCMASFYEVSTCFFQGMMYLVTLVWGGYLIAKGVLQVTDLAMYALYIGIFISPIQILVELTEMMQKGFSGFRRFLDVIDTEPEIKNSPDAVPLTQVSGDVRYDDVSFSYQKDEPVLSMSPSIFRLENLWPWSDHLEAAKPQSVPFSLVFYDVTEGSIFIDGTDIKTLTLESLRSQIGIVQQDVYLFCGSVKENIAYGKPGASMKEIIDAAKKSKYPRLHSVSSRRLRYLCRRTRYTAVWRSKTADFYRSGIP